MAPIARVFAERGEEFLRQFAARLNQVFAQIYEKGRRRNFEAIFRYEVVRRLDFYGYHDEPEDFLKVFVYDPLYVKQLVAVLQSGAVLNTRFRVYEAHISYYQHFFADYNIFGLKEIRLARFAYRENLS